MNKTMIYSLLFACLAAFSACGGDDEGSPNPTGEVSCSPLELNFIANGGEQGMDGLRQCRLDHGDTRTLV